MTDQPAPSPPARPPRYKQAVITWLAVYPALTLTLAVLGPFMETWPLPLRTFLVTVLLVPLVGLRDPAVAEPGLPGLAL
ncbi:MAG TPA: hypothetical protein VJ839_07395, partial [Candidatus Limnocylindria bacterium]|nr:hypothetical protein [Candidatus Limnocylindria bacterium]